MRAFDLVREWPASNTSICVIDRRGVAHIFGCLRIVFICRREQLGRTMKDIKAIVVLMVGVSLLLLQYIIIQEQYSICTSWEGMTRGGIYLLGAEINCQVLICQMKSMLKCLCK